MLAVHPSLTTVGLIPRVIRKRSDMKELPTEVITQAIFGARSDPATRRACEQLCRCYWPRVARAVDYAAWKHSRRHQIADLRQEVWFRLLDEDRRRLRAFDAERGAFGAFVSSRAYHEALTVIRLRRMRTVGDTNGAFDEEIPDQDSSAFPDELIDGQFFDKLIEEAAASLDARDYALLRGHHLLGRSCREMARELGIPENRLHKRNERLKKKLEKIRDRLLLEAKGSAPSRPSAVMLLELVILALAV